VKYDPFRRGPFPVGVRTLELCDETRGARRVGVEIWYPASAAHRGQDMDDEIRDRYRAAPGLAERRQSAVRGAAPARGPVPFVLYFHGEGSERREASGLCTHLASHGYVVASADHTGDTVRDVMQQKAMSPEQICANRPLDGILVMDRLLGGAVPALEGLFDPSRIGICGGSFGGWTALALSSLDRRPKASFPIVPGWGKGPLPTELLQSVVRLDDWGRPVATFVVAAELDAIVSLSALRDLYRELPSPKRFAVMKNAGHFHFAEDAEERYERALAAWKSAMFHDPRIDFEALLAAAPSVQDLANAQTGPSGARALCLAHMDEHLKGSADAREFLDRDLAGRFRARGIDLEVAGPIREEVTA
jgi:predicted dienelactone hydrolase